MEEILIRDYCNEDYPEILELWDETGLLIPERDDSRKNIEDCLATGGRFLVMFDNNTKILVGTSWMTFDGRRIYIHHFGIKPAYQRKGLGTKLAKASLAYIYSQGYQVKLEVHKQNHVAKHLYEKLGFFAYTDYDIYMIRDVRNIQPKNRELS